jgi:phosphohistidine swiveling domain-containing protein
VLSELKENITANKKKYEFNKKIILPDVILDYKDIYVRSNPKNKINFYGNGQCIGNTLFLKEYKKYNYTNKIVCIENADPGYDYLFSKKIKGLITRYGGTNSHMAIRCAELNLPSAIGVGDRVFKKVINSRKIRLDIEGKKIDFF